MEIWLMLQIRSPRRYLEPFFQFQHVTLTTTYKQRLLKHVLRKKLRHVHELYQKNKKPNTTAHIPKLREERDREREREEKERKKETGEEEKERGEERKRRKRRRKRKRKKQKE